MSKNQNKKQNPKNKVRDINTENTVVKYIMIPSGTAASTGYVDYTTNATIGGYSTQELVTRPRKKVRGLLDGQNSKDKRLKVLPPIVIYSFIKSRFKFLERQRLSDRLEKISKLMEDYLKVGQTALAEKIQDRFGHLLREQELLVCGYNKAISRKHVQQFIEASSKKIIKLTPLKNYVRVIPGSVLKKLEDVRNRKLFDDFFVLHTDPNDTSVAKTKEEKKDPILFGTIKENQETLYFIADWVDEHCDLTFDNLLDALDLHMKDVKLESDVEKAFIESLTGTP